MSPLIPVVRSHYSDLLNALLVNADQTRPGPANVFHFYLAAVVDAAVFKVWLHSPPAIVAPLSAGWTLGAGASLLSGRPAQSSRELCLSEGGP